MEGKEPQKILCLFASFYKSYGKYSDQNIEKESMPFGDGSEEAKQFYFTSKGETGQTRQGLE